MSYSSKTAPSTTKSMGSGKNYTAAGRAANSSGGTGKVINGAGTNVSRTSGGSGKFINAAAGRK